MDDYSMEVQEQSEINKPKVWQVGILYSLVVVLFVLISAKLQEVFQFNLGGVLAEVLIIMIPPLVFLFIFRFNVKKVLRLNKTSLANFALVFGIMIFSIPIVGVFNVLNLLIVKLLFGTVETRQIPIESDFAGLLIGIVVVAVSAGICEEILFRGVIQRAFERLGSVKSILTTAFLFGIMHFSFQNLFGTFLLGILIGYLVYKSDSLLVGMFAHFTNNAIAVALNWISMKMLEFMEKMGIENIDTPSGQDVFSRFEGMSAPEIVLSIAFLLAIVTFSAVIFILLIYGFIKLNSKNAEIVRKNQARVSAIEFLPFIPGLFLIAYIYVKEAQLLADTVNSQAFQTILSTVFLL